MLALILSTIIQGISAYAFSQSVGMNIHPDRTDGQWPNYAFIQALLKSENIHYVRSALASVVPSFLQTLDDQDRPDAIRSDQIVGPGLSCQQIYAKMTMWGVTSFEGPNELDLTDTNWLTDDKAQLVQTQCAAPRWNMSLIAPTIVVNDPASVVSQAYTYANMHDYFGKRPPETAAYGADTYSNGTSYGSEAYNIATAERAAPGKPVISTESGYETNEGAGGVEEYTQAAYLERLILLHAMNGVIRGYLYDLVDDDQEYGLVTDIGTPRYKPAAFALDGFLNILSDASPGGSSSCSISLTTSLPPSVSAYAICKNSGEKDLVLWQPVAIQDPSTSAWLPVTPVTVNLQTPTHAGPAFVYSQDGNYNWLVSSSASVAVNERPLIAAYGVSTPVTLPMLPAIPSP